MAILKPFEIIQTEEGFNVNIEVADESGNVQLKSSILSQSATEADAELEAREHVRQLILNGDFPILANGVDDPDIDPEDLAEKQLIAYKSKACQQINEKRDVLEASGFTYLGVRFDSDEKSVKRIAIAVLAAQVIGEVYVVNWTLADNSTISLTAADVLGLPVAMAQYSNNLHVLARERKEQIMVAETTVEVDDILALPWEV